MSKTEVKELNSQIKTLLRRKAAIEKSNAAFSSMTAAERRIAIAKDVLAQLRRKHYKVKPMQYITFSGNISGITGDTELQKVINDMPTCNVCARGALICSAVRQFNKITVDESCNEYGELDIDNLEDYENKFFPKQMSLIIEIVFEKNDINDSENDGVLSGVTVRAAIAYGKSLGTKDDRLKAIMRNIIRNNGDFVIPEKFRKAARS